MKETQEIQVPSLRWEDPLEVGMATHSSILAQRNPMERGAWRATVHGVAKSQTQVTLAPELAWVLVSRWHYFWQIFYPCSLSQAHRANDSGIASLNGLV